MLMMMGLVRGGAAAAAEKSPAKRRAKRNSQTMSVKFYSMAKMKAKQIIEVVWPAEKGGE